MVPLGQGEQACLIHPGGVLQEGKLASWPQDTLGSGAGVTGPEESVAKMEDPTEAASRVRSFTVLLFGG